MLIEGWARIYEEQVAEKGGLYSFTHSIFIYPMKSMADEREKDKMAKCLGVFPVKWVVENGHVTFLGTSGVPEPVAELEKELFDPLEEFMNVESLLHKERRE